MDPRQFFLILRARYLFALVVMAVVVGGVIAATEYLPRRFTAETQVMVDIRSPDPVALMLPPTMIPGNMSTQVDIVRSDLVARKVVRLLGMANAPATREAWLNATQGKVPLDDWVGKGLKRGLDVKPSRDSNVLTISFVGSDPRFAADAANAFAQAYIEASIELRVEPARQYAEWFGEQTKVLREQVEQAQRRLSAFQQRKGIVVTNEAMDSEVAKLNELSAKLTAAQMETREAMSKQRPTGAGNALPEVRQDAVVTTLRSSIAQLEAKIKEAEGNLGTRHPQYQRMELELAELRNRLTQEMQNVTGSFAASSTVGRSREVDLQAAVEAQRQKVLGMKREHDEIAVLARDVETAKRAYEAVTNRLNQTSLESQATRTNVSVLAPAVEPLAPSFPKPFHVMLLLGLVAGLGAACVSVVAAEMLDRRIRSAEDLEEMLHMPVIAVIERGGRLGRLPRPRPSAALPAG